MNSFNNKKEAGLPEYAQKIIDSTLLDPANEFLARPKKSIRAQLVHLGYLASDQSIELDCINSLADIIESIHSGSLIVDDIQDDSSVRRHGPALHRIQGVARAINTGNWLYFSALKKMDSLDLPELKKNQLIRILHDMLFSGHIGQALDIGVDITLVPREEVADICESTMLLKTGELMSASVRMGAVAGGISSSLEEDLSEISVELGLILQIYDDLKIFKLAFRQASMEEKNFEDLKNHRPCFIWQYAAAHENEKCLSDLRVAVEDMTDLTLLKQWIIDYEIHQNTKRHLDERKLKLFRRVDDIFGAQGFNRPRVKPIIENLIQKLEEAYEKN